MIFFVIFLAAQETLTNPCSPLTISRRRRIPRFAMTHNDQNHHDTICLETEQNPKIVDTKKTLSLAGRCGWDHTELGIISNKALAHDRRVL